MFIVRVLSSCKSVNREPINLLEVIRASHLPPSHNIGLERSAESI